MSDFVEERAMSMVRSMETWINTMSVPQIGEDLEG